MKDNSDQVSTQELWGRLFKSSTVETWLESTGQTQHLPAFSEYVSALCSDRGEKPESVIKRSDLESSYGHRLFSGTRNPSRDTVLQLAFGLELDADGAQQLLKVARATALHPRVKRDAVIAYCLHHHKSLPQTQQLLLDNSLPLLGGKRGEK